MAQVDFTPAPAFRTAGPKARMTIYFAMLIVSFIAMLTACLLMYLELSNIGGFSAVPKQLSMRERLERPTSVSVQPAAAGHAGAA